MKFCFATSYSSEFNVKFFIVKSPLDFAESYVAFIKYKSPVYSNFTYFNLVYRNLDKWNSCVIRKNCDPLAISNYRDSTVLYRVYHGSSNALRIS